MAKAKKGSISSKTVHTWRNVPRRKGEDFSERRSKSVPDQVLSIKEIMDKYSRGILDIPEADVFYLNDHEIPNWEWLSKIEQLEYAQEVRHLVAQRRAEHEKLRNEGTPVADEDLPKLPPQDTFVPPTPPEES